MSIFLGLQCPKTGIGLLQGCVHLLWGEFLFRGQKEVRNTPVQQSVEVQDVGFFVGIKRVAG